MYDSYSRLCRVLAKMPTSNAAQERQQGMQEERALHGSQEVA